MKEIIFEIISNEPIAKDVFRLSLKGDASAIEKPASLLILNWMDFSCADPFPSAMRRKIS